ncbi:MAG: nucleotidyl transferase AbiEii/AbiGii toxin family protein [Chitinophagaceae bacterium]|nr:nucleotidyl transferase AbiEii/AbiGii toxin family protein [Chitinophagaceae bacterium]
MLNLNEIVSAYPPSLHMHRSFILREYLQYKILEILFEGQHASKFCFLGGTCLRIVHNNSRFSEDLDFDNFQISDTDFSAVSESIKEGLEKQGYQIEMKQVIRGTYHCYIRFPGLLYEQGLSGFKTEKILIQLDTEPQYFDFKPNYFVLNKFDVTTGIFVTPPDLLLAQKFTALCSRKRKKGRDFFDIVFLLSKSIQPNYDFLNLKLGVSNANQLRERVGAVCKGINMEEMVADVSPFLFNPVDEKKIRLFLPIIEQANLG